jgi:hypothetical protein
LSGSSRSSSSKRLKKKSSVGAEDYAQLFAAVHPGSHMADEEILHRQHGFHQPARSGSG